MKLVKIVLFIAFLIAIFQERTGQSTPLQIVLAVVIAILCIVALAMIVTRKLPRLIWLWALFALIVAFNVFIAWEDGLDLFVWAKFTLPVLAWPAAAIVTYCALKTRKDALQMYWWTVAAIAVPSTMFFIAVFLNIPKVIAAGNLEVFRELTMWGQGIGGTGFLLVLLAVPFIKKAYAFALVLMGAFAIILSSVRSIWIGLLIVMVIALLITHRARVKSPSNDYLRSINRQLTVGAIALVLVLAVLFSFFSPAVEPIVTRARSLLETRVVGDLSFQDRIEESRAIFDNIKTRPVNMMLGAGAGAYFFFIPTRKNYVDQSAYNNYSHNFYVHLLWNYGIIALALFLIGLIQVVRRSYGLLRSDDRQVLGPALGIIFTFIGTAIVANVSSFYDSPLWYIAFGTLTGIACFLANSPEPSAQDAESDNPTGQRALPES
jgi:hypothetical protein